MARWITHAFVVVILLTALQLGIPHLHMWSYVITIIVFSCFVNIKWFELVLYGSDVEDNESLQEIAQ